MWSPALSKGIFRRLLGFFHLDARIAVDSFAFSNSKMEGNPILRHSFEFSVQVLEYCDLLIAQCRFTISNQLSKSGTSIGANIEEAQDAESKDDFIHKMKLAAKEVRETGYWLRLCAAANGYPDCSQLLVKLDEIRRILNKIIGTSKIRYQKNRYSRKNEQQ